MIHSKIERSLAGLQAGMLGGFAMLAVLALVSALDRRTWWSYPNLLAAWFYGPRSIGGGLGWPTVAGGALQMLVAGTAGAIFGALFGRHSGSRRIALLGLFWGFFVFFGTEQFYKFSSPVVVAYMPRSASVVAHMIYGICLASISRIGGVPGGVNAPGPEPAAGGTPVATSVLEPPATASLGVRDRPEAAPHEIPGENETNVKPDGEETGSKG
jgi:hypothetical protein